MSALPCADAGAGTLYPPLRRRHPFGKIKVDEGEISRMKLRLATSHDATTIAALHAASWRMTYQDTLSEDYLQQTVLADREAVWAERLASPKANQVRTASRRRERNRFCLCFCSGAC